MLNEASRQPSCGRFLGLSRRPERTWKQREKPRNARQRCFEFLKQCSSNAVNNIELSVTIPPFEHMFSNKPSFYNQDAVESVQSTPQDCTFKNLEFPSPTAGIHDGGLSNFTLNLDESINSSLFELLPNHFSI